MIYIDLDGVLADLEASMFRHSRTCIYDDVEFLQICKRECRSVFLDSPFIEKNRWRLTGNYRILTTLPGLDRYLEINGYSKETLESYEILRKNKLTWCKKHNIPVDRVIVLTHRNQKIEYCRKGDILYDDYEKNIADWEAAGGWGILVPYERTFLGD